MSLDYDLQFYAQIVAERTAGAEQPLDTEHYLLAKPRILNAEEAIAGGLIHTIDELPISIDSVQWSVHA